MNEDAIEARARGRILAESWYVALTVAFLLPNHLIFSTDDIHIYN